MSVPIYSLELAFEQDIVQARKRCREIAALLGYDQQDQTRVTTALSEIARNAFQYAGGGRVRFFFEAAASAEPARFEIEVEDSGPGIANLPEVLGGGYVSPTGMGMGILGARRLMDYFEVAQRPKGTLVRMGKALPLGSPVARPADLRRLAEKLAASAPANAYDELQQQNQELVKALEALRAREAELALLNQQLAETNAALESTNQELEETNRGVVALYAELDEKNVALRRADELKTKFLSNMTHEFRTPLNSVLGLSRLLLDRVDGPLTAEQEKQVRFVHRAADDLLVLVNDMLDLAKVEAGQTSVRLGKFRPADLFGTLKGMMRPLIPENGRVALVFEDVGQLSAVRSDEGKIAQVLRNLISNALKFTEAGEVRVGARFAAPTVLELKVSDTGIGIAPEHQAQVFSQFGQLDSDLQRKVKGTGLGLPLSKSLVELLGGRLDLRSAPGQGSVFTASIPVAVEGDGAVARESRPLFLVAADGADALDFYSAVGAEIGFDVKQVTDPRELAEQIRLWEPRALLIDPSAPSASFLVAKHSVPTALVGAAPGAGPSSAGFPTHVTLLPSSDAAVRSWLLRDRVNRPQRRLLIIDDEETSRYLLRNMLRGYQFQIMECGNGPVGLATAERELPDLIFLDYAMPGMTGLEVLRALKRNPGTRHIPVVIHSSKVFTAAELDQLSLDAVAVLPKGMASREARLRELDWIIGRALPSEMNEATHG